MSATAARVVLVSMLSIVLASVVLATPVAAAGRGRCRVTDVSTGATFRHLQPAVDAAAAGAKLRGKGRCVGTGLGLCLSVSRCTDMRDEQCNQGHDSEQETGNR